MERVFGKNETNVAKGVAIALMVFHHLFFDADVLSARGVIFPLLGSGYGNMAGQLGKICVFLFVFLSAYGITRVTARWRHAPGLSEDAANREMTAYSVRRYISVASGYLFIFVIVYILAWVLGPRLALENPAQLFGTGASGLYYTLLDALGLSFILRGPSLNPEWWFLSIAILIVFAMPAFLRWYKKAGITSYVLCALLTGFIYMLEREGMGHLTLLPLGIACAENNWLERYRSWRPVKGEGRGAALASKLVRLLLAGAWFGFFLFFSGSMVTFYLGYQLATPALVLLAWELVAPVPLLGRGVAFLGKHSYNIFMVHTLVLRAAPDVFYGLRYALLIFLALLAASLLLSLLLEGAKKLTGYTKLMAALAAKAQPRAAG